MQAFGISTPHQGHSYYSWLVCINNETGNAANLAMIHPGGLTLILCIVLWHKATMQTWWSFSEFNHFHCYGALAQHWHIRSGTRLIDGDCWLYAQGTTSHLLNVSMWGQLAEQNNYISSWNVQSCYYCKYKSAIKSVSNFQQQKQSHIWTRGDSAMAYMDAALIIGLRSQTGALPDQLPSSWHSRVLSSMRL